MKASGNGAGQGGGADEGAVSGRPGVAAPDANAFYGAVWNDGPDLVCALEVGGTVTASNPVSEALLGYAPGAMVGRHVGDLAHPSGADALERAWDRALARQATTFDLALRHRDGRPVSCLATAVPVMGYADSVAAVLTLFKDQSKRVDAEAAERQALVALRQAEERLRSTLADTNTIRFEYDDLTKTVEVSENIVTMLGFDPAEAAKFTKDFERWLHPADSERLYTAMAEAASVEGRQVDEMVRLVRSDGESVWINLHCRNRFDESGTFLGLVGIGVDVSERHRVTEELAQSELAFRATLEATSDAFVGIDGEGLITDWNLAAAKTFGWSREEALGRFVEDLIIPPEHRQAHLAGLARYTEGKVTPLPSHNRRIETTAMGRDGRTFPVELTITSVLLAGERCYRAFIRDITDRRAAEAELERRALVDSLTGLPNRTLMTDRLEQAIARLARHQGSLAVLFVDVDRFKIVNDSLGHGAGDRLLRVLGQRLPDAVRANDTVARFGGDELIVLCEQVDGVATALQVAERVRGCITAPIVIDGQEIVLTASIGVTLTKDTGAEPEKLVQEADAAMYRAKEKGRDRIEVFAEEMRMTAVTSLHLGRDLRRAVEEGELRLDLQPIVELDDEHLVATEALVRWDHPARGLLGPGDFIEAAEESGLIVPLGRWVIEEACRLSAELNESRPHDPLQIFVNVSGRQLAQPKMPATVGAALEKAGVQPGTLCLEITESVLMDSATEVADALATLRDMGVELWVDDFGTGWSSLVYLRRFPVNGLKVDRGFTAGLGVNGVDTAIVESVVQLGHNLDICVIAEGVETARQLQALRELRCDRGQGYYWSEPLRSEQINAPEGPLRADGWRHVAKGTRVQGISARRGPRREDPREATH